MIPSTFFNQTETIRSEKQLRDALREANTARLEAEAKKTSSVYLAQAMEASAKADGDAAERYEKKKLFEQHLRLGDTDAEFANHGRKVIMGDAAKGIVASFTDARNALGRGDNMAARNGR